MSLRVWQLVKCGTCRELYAGHGDSQEYSFLMGFDSTSQMRLATSSTRVVQIVFLIRDKLLLGCVCVCVCVCVCIFSTEMPEFA